MIHSKNLVPVTSHPTQGGMNSKTIGVQTKAPPNIPSSSVPRNHKNKKARVKALLVALDDLDSEISGTEDDGPVVAPAPAISEDHHSDACRTSPAKVVQGATMNSPFPSSLIARRMNDDSLSSSPYPPGLGILFLIILV